MIRRLNLRKVELRDLAKWGSGHIYWAFNHVLSAIPGALLAVPTHLVIGSLRDVPALCPVPYTDALAVLDEQRRVTYADVLELALADQVQLEQLQAIVGPGCWLSGSLPELRSRIYRHENGTRLAVANELVLNEKSRSTHAEDTPS